MSRLYQFILIISTLLASWLGMLGLHELGHVLGAWLTGGTVQRVVLHPLSISRTDLADNPQPLDVAWAGPISGVILPLALWALAVAMHAAAESQSVVVRPIRNIRVLLPPFLFRFFAGFCLVANGLYIGLGSFAGIGDCGDLLRHGAQLWQLWLFGAVTAPSGLALWHGQGRYFGLGPNPDKIQPTTACAAVFACLALVVFFTAHTAMSE